MNQLKRRDVKAQDAATQRSKRMSLGVARLAFWSSFLLLLLLRLDMVFYAAMSFGLSG